VLLASTSGTINAAAAVLLVAHSDSGAGAPPGPLLLVLSGRVGARSPDASFSTRSSAWREVERVVTVVVGLRGLCDPIQEALECAVAHGALA
jgi:hypothetical protein